MGINKFKIKLDNKIYINSNNEWKYSIRTTWGSTIH